MECVVGEKGEPLRPDNKTSVPYCAAQRNLDNAGVRTGRCVPAVAGNPLGTGIRGLPV
jgi:hypothetical protein